MSKARQLAALCAVLVGLLIVAGIVAIRSRPAPVSINPMRDVETTRFHRIVIENRNRSFTLTRDGSNWTISGPFNDDAEEAACLQLSQSIKEFTVGTVVSENPDRFAQFGLDKDQRSHVTVFVSGGDKPRLDIYVGRMGSAYDSSYVQLANEKTARIASKLPAFQITRAPEDYRRRLVFNVVTVDVNGIEAKAGSESVSFAKSSDTWTRGGVAASSEMASAFLTGLVQLRAVDFVTSSDTVKMGFNAPVLTVTLKTNQKTVTAVVGAKTQTAKEAPALRYVRVEGREPVLMIYDTAVTQEIASIKALR